MISNIHTCEFKTLMWSLIHLWNFTKLIQFRNQNEELQQNNNDHAYINGIDLIAELKKKKNFEFNQNADDQAYNQHILKQ